MRRLLLHSLGFVTMILAAGCGKPMNSRSLRFLALGDSYTIGESVSEKDRWPMQLAARLRDEGIDVSDPQIVARTGWTTDELSAAIDVANPKGPYQLVTLLIGVNNQFRGRSVEEFRAQFAALLKCAIGLAGDDPKRVIVLSIPDWGATPFAEGRDRAKIGAEIDRFNEVCRQETDSAGARFVDITAISRKAKEDHSLVAGDGLHPSGRMYREWVDLVLPDAKTGMKSAG